AFVAAELRLGRGWWPLRDASAARPVAPTSPAASGPPGFPPSQLALRGQGHQIHPECNRDRAR
ncbi:MAG: hypothetical protein V3T81_05530, partial [Thermoanaerobaculia bacterium]